MFYKLLLQTKNHIIHDLFLVLTVLMTINITSYQHVLGQFRFIAK